MNLFKDIFTLLVRLAGLSFIYKGLAAIGPLLNLNVLRLAVRDDLVSTILPILFSIVVGCWFLGTKLLTRLAYPEPIRHLPKPCEGKVERTPILTTDQKLAALVRPVVVLLLMLFVCSAQGKTFKWDIVGDIHAGAPSQHYGTTWSPATTTSNDWAQYMINAKLHLQTSDGEIYPGDLFEQNNDVNTLSSISNSFMNPTNTAGWADPLSVFSYISNQITAGIFEFASNGNHDADDTNASRIYDNAFFCNSNSHWNLSLGTNVFARSPYFESTRYANDTRQMCMLYTNGPLKFVICSIAWCTNPIVTNPNLTPPAMDIVSSYTDQVAWVKSKWLQYPDHLGVCVAHHALNTFGLFDNQDCGPYGQGTYTNIGPGPALLTLASCPNAFLVIVGHNRATLSQHNLVPVPSRPGGFMLAIEWNTQAFSPFTQMFDELTFSPDTMTLYVNAYDISLGRYMTNGESRGVQANNGLTWSPGTQVQFNYQYQVPIPNLNSVLKTIFRLL